MSEISQTVKTIQQQLCQMLHQSLWTGSHKRSKFHNPKKFMFIQIDENTLRANKGKTNVDIEYNVGLDLYNVTVHRIKKNWDVDSEKTEGVYFDQLISFF